MFIWPFKLSPWGFGTIIAGVVVVSSSIAAWLVDDKVDACNAGWSAKVSDANLALKNATIEADKKVKELEDKLRTAEEKASLQSVKDEAILEKQRETDKLSLDCDRCRVPNSWIWVRQADPAGSVNRSRAVPAESRRVDAPKAP